MGLAETAQLAVRIGLDDKLSPGLKKASGNLSRFEGSAKKVGGGIGKLAGGLARVGVVAGGAVAVGFATAAKTVIDFDDAFAGVAKTVEGVSPAGLQKINDQLHALATRIPVKYTDLADIAAEAGALGVAAPQIAHFTEVVARLSASTVGLTVEAASEAFGKFRNTLHLADKDLDKAASSLLALGNAGASSEGDIIEIGKRFAAAGNKAGLSAADVLGFSSAIASLGVEPEAAGSSLSRLFNNITKYIGTGDKKVKQFAATTHQSVAEFKKSFDKDAKGTVVAFLTELGKLDKFKQAALLKNAGITNTRDINAIQLLSGNVGELVRQLGVSEDAFKKGTALSEVSTKRFDTLAKKLVVLKNNFKEAAYLVGEGFAPALGRATDKLIAFLQVPENKQALRDLGTQIGTLIDGVDWNALRKGAEGAVAAIKPMVTLLLTAAKALNALPSDVKGAGAALLVANKVSGGAIVGGIGQIVGGLGEALAKSLASSIPVFGKAFVQPVFVTNLGPGGLGGGIPGAGAGGAGTGAALAAGTAGAAIFIPDMHAFNSDLATQLSKSNNEYAQTLGASFAEQANKDTPWDQILIALGAKQPSGGKIKGTLPGPGVTSRDAGYEAAGTTPWKDLGKVVPSIHDLRVKLSDVLRREARAERAGNTRLSARLQHKADQIRSHIDVLKAATAARLAAVKAEQRRTSAYAAATKRAIDRKRLAVSVKNNISVSTSVSLSAIQKQARISSRVARTTALAVR